MSRKTKFIAAGVLVFVLFAAGIGGTIAFAQGPTPTPPGNAWAQLYWQTLAQKLGTTVEKLQQTMTDARKDAINQAVQKGLITQAQADAMLQRMQNAAPGAGFGKFGLRGGGFAFRDAGLEAAAKTLGMSTADLTTALKNKTLATLAQEKNVDAAKLRAAIADAEKAAIDQAVKDGKITQAQADALKAKINPDNIDLNRWHFGASPRGWFGGFGKR